MKDKISSLGEVLKKFEFDKVRLEAMFPKKHTPKKHVHTTHAHHTTHTHNPKSQHIHTHHARHTTHTKYVHTPHSHYAFIYCRVYSCTYCGWKGHLAKFFFDRINTSNEDIWVLNANIIGPKKIWVPKLTNSLLDVGTHQGFKRYMTWDINNF